jgi:hypothetical protein
MYSNARALAVQRRHEADLRAAGLPVCPENLKWWEQAPAAERRFWTGRHIEEVDDDYHHEHGYTAGPPVVASRTASPG